MANSRPHLVEGDPAGPNQNANESNLDPVEISKSADNCPFTMTHTTTSSGPCFGTASDTDAATHAQTPKATNPEALGSL